MRRRTTHTTHRRQPRPDAPPLFRFPESAAPNRSGFDVAEQIAAVASGSSRRAA